MEESKNRRLDNSKNRRIDEWRNQGIKEWNHRRIPESKNRAIEESKNRVIEAPPCQSGSENFSCLPPIPMWQPSVPEKSFGRLSLKRSRTRHGRRRNALATLLCWRVLVFYPSVVDNVARHPPVFFLRPTMPPRNSALSFAPFSVFPTLRKFLQRLSFSTLDSR